MDLIPWDHVVELLDKVGICGITLLLLVVHMVQEERYRYRRWRRKEDDEW